MNKNIEMTEALSDLIKRKKIMVVEAISVKLKSNRKCELPEKTLPSPKFSYVSDEGTLMEAQGKLTEEWWLNG